MGEFFSTLPDVARALWEFMQGFYGVAITGVSVVLLAGFLFLAHTFHGTREWLSATFGMMAGTIGMFWVFGIIPSSWVYFADGNRPLLEGTIIPSALPLMDNFYVVFRDSVVAGETTIGVIALAVLAARLQKRYPGTLAEGEERGPTSGGYK